MLILSQTKRNRFVKSRVRYIGGLQYQVFTVKVKIHFGKFSTEELYGTIFPQTKHMFMWKKQKIKLGKQKTVSFRILISLKVVKAIQLAEKAVWRNIFLTEYALHFTMSIQQTLLELLVSIFASRENYCFCVFNWKLLSLKTSINFIISVYNSIFPLFS